MEFEEGRIDAQPLNIMCMYFTSASDFSSDVMQRRTPSAHERQADMLTASRGLCSYGVEGRQKVQAREEDWQWILWW